MKRKLVTSVLLILLTLSITGCGKYYMVKDPNTGNTYYTDCIEERNTGAIKFKDANTGSVVTIQNSEINEIPKDEYKKNTKEK